MLQELAAAEQTSEMACLFRESLHLLSARNIPSSKPTRKQAVQDLTRKVVRINVKPFMYGATTNIYAGELYGNQVSVYTSNLGHQPSAKNIEDVEVGSLKIKFSFSDLHMHPLGACTLGLL